MKYHTFDDMSKDAFNSFHKWEIKCRRRRRRVERKRGENSIKIWRKFKKKMRGKKSVLSLNILIDNNVCKSSTNISIC